jgi:hypothetical protein
MGGVIRFEQAIASSAVITKLVEFGYLQPGARHRATAVARAIDRLRNDLVRQGVTCGRRPWQELSDGSAALVGCGHVSGLLMRRG